MQTVKVEIPQNQAGSYPIFIGQGLLENAGTYIKQYTKAKKLLVVSNNTINSLYGEEVKKSLEQAGYEVYFLLLEEGEQYKNADSLQKIWTEAIRLKLERKDALIALGGGVIGDVTGLAASTYLRGVGFIQLPTTLLAQVDSSIGGKVAINHDSGKNLIGSFYQPKAVLADISALKTLSLREFKVGLAEVLKYGFIEKSCGLSGLNSSFSLYLMENKASIMALEPSIVENLVKYCCRLKAAVVNKDEKESGLRAILNFGHTTGHAVEKCYGYKGINHGEAVAIGMKGAFFIAMEKGLISQKYFEDALSLLNNYEMDYRIEKNISIDSLYEAMQVDKKVQSGKIRFILPVSPSEVRIFDDVNKQQLNNALKKLY